MSNIYKKIVSSTLNAVKVNEEIFLNDSFSRLVSQAKSRSIELNNKYINKIVLKRDETFNNGYQKYVWDEISSPNRKDIVISAPTGFGKSYLIRELAKKIVVDGDKSKVYIIVPTKQLIADYIEHFKITMNKYIEYITEAITSDNIKEKRVFVLTQERFFYFFRQNSKWLSEKDTIIFDEVHKLDFIYDNMNQYTKKSINTITIKNNNGFFREDALLGAVAISKKFKLKRIGFMPMFSKKKNNEIFEHIKWAFPQNINIYFDPVRRTSLRFSKSIENINFDKDKPMCIYPKIDEKMFKDFSLSNVAKSKTLFYISKSKLINRDNPELKKILDLLSSDDNHDKSNNNSYKKISKYYPNVKEDDNLYLQMLKKGIGIIIGDTPLFIRKIFEEEYTKGNIKHILANQTIIEGINLSPKYLFVINKNTNRNSRTDTSISNLFGRTAREGSTNGNLVLFGDTPTIKNLFESSIKKDNQSFDSIDKNIIKNDPKGFEGFKKKLNEKIVERVNKFILSKDFKWSDELPTILSDIKNEKNKESLIPEINISISSDSPFQLAQKISKNVSSFIRKNIKNIDQIEDHINGIVEIINKSRGALEKILLNNKVKRDQLNNCVNKIMNSMKNNIERLSFVEQTSLDKLLNDISNYEPDIYDKTFQYVIHDNIIWLGRISAKNLEIKIKKEALQY